MQDEQQENQGFVRAGSACAVGWFDMAKVGNVLSGTLAGMYELRDNLRAGGVSMFFQVRVDRECEVRAERGDEAKMVAAKPGDFVNVNHGPKTRGWELLIPDIRNGAVYEVQCRVVGPKIKIMTGRSLHNLEVFYKMTRMPMPVEEDVGIGLRARLVAATHELEQLYLVVFELSSKKASKKARKLAVERLRALIGVLFEEVRGLRGRLGEEDDRRDVAVYLRVAENARWRGHVQVARRVEKMAAAMHEEIRVRAERAARLVPSETRERVE